MIRRPSSFLVRAKDLRSNSLSFNLVLRRSAKLAPDLFQKLVSRKALGLRLTVVFGPVARRRLFVDDQGRRRKFQEVGRIAEDVFKLLSVSLPSRREKSGPLFSGRVARVRRTTIWLLPRRSRHVETTDRSLVEYGVS